MRNILLASSRGVFLAPRDAATFSATPINQIFQSYLGSESQFARDRIGFALFHQAEVEAILKALHLPTSAPLSILAVELLPPGTNGEVGSVSSPVLTAQIAEAATTLQTDTVFPFGRILRSSPLTPIQPAC